MHIYSKPARNVENSPIYWINHTFATYNKKTMTGKKLQNPKYDKKRKNRWKADCSVNGANKIDVPVNVCERASVEKFDSKESTHKPQNDDCRRSLIG